MNCKFSVHGYCTHIPKLRVECNGIDVDKKACPHWAGVNTPININSTVKLVARKFEDAKLKAIQELINEVYKVHYNNNPNDGEMPPEIAWPPKEIEQQLEYMEQDGYSIVQHDVVGARKTIIVLFGPDGNVRAQRTIELVIKTQVGKQE